MQIRIPKKLIPFTKPKRFKIMIGGRGSAKSETAAALHAGMVYQSGCRDVCCREFQTSIKQSVHSLISRKIGELGLDGFNIMDTEVRHQNGGQIIYQGLSRDPEAVKSVDDAELCWAEEAQSLSEESIEQLTPSIRGKDAEIWFTANLRSSKDAFSQRFIKPFEKALRKDGYYEDDLHMIAWVNYCDNPWFPRELEKERAHDKLTMTEAEYGHKWLGEYNDTVENAIILPAWFDACVDAHKKLGIDPVGIDVVAHDPSDLGADDKGLVHRHGILVKDAMSEAHGDINQGADWAIEFAHGIKPELFTWDCDGMGVGLRRQFSDAFKNTNTSMELFRGSMEVDNPEGLFDGSDIKTTKTNKQSFKNKRAQYYWQVRERCRKTYLAVAKNKYQDPTQLISFSSDIRQMDLLRSEMCSVPRKPNPLGLIQIASKPEMAVMGISSPNIADSVMMSFSLGEMGRMRRRRHIKRRIVR